MGVAQIEYSRSLVSIGSCNRHTIRANVNKPCNQAKRRECLPRERLVEDKKHTRNKALLAGNLIPLLRNSERREDEEIGLLH